MCGAQDAIPLGKYFWPTPNQAFVEHGRMEGVLQSTAIGSAASGSFGCVRNNGKRFHEGLDLKAIFRDSRGEALDPIYAFHGGIVRYVNRAAGDSRYGRYLVLEHPDIAPGLVTLYAHLRSIREEIQPGASVEGGQNLGVMGRSASYSIPRSRAHLHFEVGFWMGPGFQTWYDRQPFGTRNEHGSFNGMNIISLDTWSLLGALRRGEAEDVWEFLMSEQIAVEVFIRDTSIPELLKVNPSLMANVSLPRDQAGWRIEFTWYGMPTRFTAIEEDDFPEKGWMSVNVLRPDLLEPNPCLDIARNDIFGGAGGKLKTVIQLMFVK